MAEIVGWLVPFAVISILILLNGLFVAAEFAMIGAPKAVIDRQAAEGDRLAQRISHILADPRRQDQYIATAQLGVTTASLGLGMYGEHVLSGGFHRLLGLVGFASWEAAHTLATLLAVGFLTYFHVTLGEMVPKSIALQFAERAARWTTPPLLAIRLMLLPAVLLLNGIGTLLLKLMGVDRQVTTAEHFLSPEELQFLVAESQESGEMKPEAGRVLLELFQFGALTAAEVMVPRISLRGIPLDASPAQIADTLRVAPHTRYPVYQGNFDHIVGMVHIKDLLRLLRSNAPLGEAVVRDVPRVPGTAPLDVVLRTMRETRVQLVVVMDEFGGTAGTLTIEDLFNEVIDVDDGPTGDSAIDNSPDGRLIVSGQVRLEQVGENLGLALKDDQVATVSGLVLKLLNRPPEPGECLRHEGLIFQVEATENYGVKSCIIFPEDTSGATPAAPED